MTGQDQQGSSPSDLQMQEAKKAYYAKMAAQEMPMTNPFAERLPKPFAERLSDKISETEKKLTELKALQTHIANNPGFIEALRAFSQIDFY